MEDTGLAAPQSRLTAEEIVAWLREEAKFFSDRNKERQAQNFRDAAYWVSTIPKAEGRTPEGPNP